MVVKICKQARETPVIVINVPVTSATVRYTEDHLFVFNSILGGDESKKTQVEVEAKNKGPNPVLQEIEDWLVPLSFSLAQLQ